MPPPRRKLDRPRSPRRRGLAVAMRMFLESMDDVSGEASLPIGAEL